MIMITAAATICYSHYHHSSPPSLLSSSFIIIIHGALLQNIAVFLTCLYSELISRPCATQKKVKAQTFIRTFDQKSTLRVAGKLMQLVSGAATLGLQSTHPDVDILLYLLHFCLVFSSVFH